MALVFQYGSNTSAQRLNATNRLRGDATSLGLALTCESFHFDFTVWSETNKCAAADIVLGNGEKIWGVLYEIPNYLISRDTAGNRKSLDAIEGPKYQRQEIQVCKATDLETPLTVLTYTVINKQTGFRTSYEYVTHILTGLHEHQAPTKYIEYVMSCIVRNNPTLKSKQFAEVFERVYQRDK